MKFDLFSEAHGTKRKIDYSTVNTNQNPRRLILGKKNCAIILSFIFNFTTTVAIEIVS